MISSADFEAAAQRAQNLPSKPSNTVLLQLYALYKQGTEGDVTGTRPGGFDFAGGAKYDAWAALKGQSPEQAQEEYVALVQKLLSE